MNQVLSDPAAWAVIVGFFSPPVIALFQQPWLKGWERSGITFLFSLLAGAGTAYFAGEFTGLSVVSAILLVLVSAITFYKGLWKPTNIAGKVEFATSKKNRVDPYAPVGDYQEGPPPIEEEQSEPVATPRPPAEPVKDEQSKEEVPVPDYDAPPAVPDDTGK